MAVLSINRDAVIDYTLEFFDPDRMRDFSQWRALFKAAYDETGFGEFNPDYDNYCDMQHKGNLVLFSAWRGNELVGYTVHAIFRHYNDRNLKVGQRRSQYVKPDFRGRGIATRMLQLTHDEMKRRGVKYTLLNTRAYRHQKLGYKRMETVWMKEL